MKKYQLFGFIIVVTLLINYNLFGQNPNWTLPPKVYKPQSGIVALPNPAGGYPTEYQGEISTNLHGAYSDPNGNTLFFTKDEFVYDKDGRLVGNLQTASSEQKRGFNERLILPMGNSCSRFAILFFGSHDYYGADLENFSTDSRLRFYMGVYDMNATNPYYGSFSIGSLDGMTASSGYESVVDISDRDGMLYSMPGSDSYYGYNATVNTHGDTITTQSNYVKNYQIASSKLIDNCFYLFQMGSK